MNTEIAQVCRDCRPVGWDIVREVAVVELCPLHQAAAETKASHDRLLVACQAAEGQPHGDWCSSGRFSEKLGDCDCFRRLVRAAIAQATGGQP